MTDHVVGRPDPDRLHRDAVVIDGVDVSVPSRARFERMRAAGLTAVCETVALYEGFEETMRVIARWEATLERERDLIRPVRTVADIDAAKAEGRVGIAYGLQNASPLEDEPGFVGLFHAVGVRVVQLAYMYRNLVGAGVLEPNDPGISEYGAHVVLELQRHGIAIDLSHCGRRTTRDAVELAEGPLLFTHTAARALYENPRNRTDEELRMVAGTGGVVGIVAFPSFLGDRDPTIDDWFRHLEHVASVVGIDHVGIGNDFIEGQPEGFADRAYFHRPHPPGLVPEGWPWPYPKGIASVDDYPRITAGLVERGYREDELAKILGGNIVRVLAEVWR